MERAVAQRIRRLTTLLAAFSLVVLVALPGSWPPLHTVLAAAIGICVAELVAVRAGLGNQGWSISLTETVIACALLLKPGPWMILAMAIGMTSALLLRRGKDPIKIAFNAAMHAATTAAAALVVVTLGPSVFSVCVGMFVCWSMNLVVVGRAISLVSHKPMRELLGRHLPHSATASTSNTSLGLIAGLLWASQSPWAALLLLPPVVLVMWIYTTVWRQQDAAGLLSEIVSAHEQTRTTTPHSIASAIAAVSRNTLGVEQATIVVLERGQPPSAYALLRESEGAVVPRDAHRVMATWWARVAMTRPDAMSTGVRGDQAWILLRAGEQDDPGAVVHLTRPLSRGPYTRSEERIARQLLDQTSSWVDSLNAMCDLADLQLGSGARRAHRARALETATTRLVDVANAPAASVESLVEAMRTVDAIVADIVGHAVRPGGGGNEPPRYGGGHRST